MDQSTLIQATMLNDEIRQIDAALNIFNRGGKIVNINVATESAQQVPGVVMVSTTAFPFPQQMIEDIKSAISARREEVVAELRDLGVTAEAPGPPGPSPVPRIISRRQFFQASAGKGMITQVEALDAVRHGEIPTVMQQGLDTLSPNEKFAAEMLLSGAGEFERRHPLVEKFAEVMHMPPEVLDDVWRYAATL